MTREREASIRHFTREGHPPFISTPEARLCGMVRELLRALDEERDLAGHADRAADRLQGLWEQAEAKAKDAERRIRVAIRLMGGVIE